MQAAAAAGALAGRWRCRYGLGGVCVKQECRAQGYFSLIRAPLRHLRRSTDTQPLPERRSSPALVYGLDVGWWPHVLLKSALRLP